MKTVPRSKTPVRMEYEKGARAHLLKVCQGILNVTNNIDVSVFLNNYYNTLVIFSLSLKM